MEHTVCSETLAFKLQTSVNNPEESIQQQGCFLLEILCFLHSDCFIVLTKTAVSFHAPLFYELVFYKSCH
jgi:hypothetical protein